jgi:hypothetical protein
MVLGVEKEQQLTVNDEKTNSSIPRHGWRSAAGWIGSGKYFDLRTRRKTSLGMGFSRFGHDFKVHSSEKIREDYTSILEVMSIIKCSDQ